MCRAWAGAPTWGKGSSCSYRGRRRNGEKGGRLRTVSARLQTIVILAHLGVGVTVLLAVTVLTSLGKPISAFAAGIFGAVVGLAGGGAAATATLGTALNGKSAVSPELIANQP